MSQLVKVSSSTIIVAAILALTTVLAVIVSITTRPLEAPPAHDAAIAPRQAAVSTAFDGYADAGFVGVVVSSSTVDVTSLQEGTILTIDARMGERVKEGQVLVTLEPGELGHELDMAQAQLDVDNADIERAMVEKRQAEDRKRRANAAAAHLNIEELSSARYAAQVAMANEKALRARRQVDRAKTEQLKERLERRWLKAPIDSVVAERYLDKGSTVNAGTTVLRLVGQASWRVRFAIPEGEYGVVKGSSVLVRLAQGNKALSWQGSVIEVAPSIDPASMTRAAEAVLAVPEGGPSFGAMVRVHLEGASP